MSRVAVAVLAIALGAAAELAQAQPRFVALPANDLVYDAVRQRLYASVPSSAGARGNTVTAIDPFTGTIGASVFVGSEPGRLELSDDGQFLYVGLNGAPAVRRVDLQTFTATLQFPVGSDPFYGPLYVEDLDVAPGQPTVVAVSRRRPGISPEHGGVAIFDNGVARPTVTQDHTGSGAIEFGATASRIYGFNNDTTEAGFRRLTVTGAGVTEQDVAAALFPSFTRDFVFEGGRAFASSGTVVDAETKMVLGTFTGIGGPFDVPSVRPALDRGVVHFLSGATIRTYDSQTFVSLGSTAVPGVSGDTASLVRVGETGLAFRTASGQLVLVDVPFVPPPPPPPVSPLQLALTMRGCVTCEAGDTLIVGGLVTNAGPMPVRVEVKAGVVLPGGQELSASSLGSRHFEITLPPGLNASVEFFRATLPAGLPPGAWTYEVTLLSPDVGRTLARDVKGFTVP